LLFPAEKADFLDRPSSLSSSYHLRRKHEEASILATFLSRGSSYSSFLTMSRRRERAEEGISCNPLLLLFYEKERLQMGDQR